VKNEKTFFQELYKALEAEETRDNTDATSPTRGSEDLFMATDPPGDGGAKNRVLEGLTYIKEASKVLLPEKDHKAFLSSVGAPPLPPAKPPVGSVCKADGTGLRSFWNFSRK